ncbi:MAG: hypothetical protein K6T70_12795, partial [Meiothermus ruber]|uniref:hypothetical protein n=1 Tax=Meiothermus ruber TaxID=277 RepID=UPI0023F9178D
HEPSFSLAPPSFGFEFVHKTLQEHGLEFSFFGVANLANADIVGITSIHTKGSYRGVTASV